MHKLKCMQAQHVFCCAIAVFVGFFRWKSMGQTAESGTHLQNRSFWLAWHVKRSLRNNDISAHVVGKKPAKAVGCCSHIFKIWHTNVSKQIMPVDLTLTISRYSRHFIIFINNPILPFDIEDSYVFFCCSPLRMGCKPGLDRKKNPFHLCGNKILWLVSVKCNTLQEINISHLGKRKIIFKIQNGLFRGYVSSQEGIYQTRNQLDLFFGYVHEDFSPPMKWWWQSVTSPGLGILLMEDWNPQQPHGMYIKPCK